MHRPSHHAPLRVVLALASITERNAISKGERLIVTVVHDGQYSDILRAFYEMSSVQYATEVRTVWRGLAERRNVHFTRAENYRAVSVRG